MGSDETLYKSDKYLKEQFGTRLRDFGNFHFGMVANAFGFNLETSLYGGGAYKFY